MVIMTKTRGILMSTWSIQRYIAGRKNQTRRLKGLWKINENPEEWKFEIIGVLSGAVFQNKKTGEDILLKAPYGFIGDSLYFKETWATICNVALPYCECDTEEEIKKNHYTEYKADTGNQYPGDWPEDEAKGNDEAPKWKSSMFMPQKNARFHDIPIINVRIERLHDITEMDAMAEGLWNGWTSTGPTNYHREEYFKLWDTINGRKMPAERNPWVWVYEFPFHVK